MKQIMILCTLLGIFISLVGCGSTSSNTDDSNLDAEKVTVNIQEETSEIHDNTTEASTEATPTNDIESVEVSVPSSTIEDVSEKIKNGRYVGNNITIDVTGNEGADGQIRIEYVQDVKSRSVYRYSGILNKDIEFTGNDGNADISYHLVFDDNSVKLTMKQKDITDLMNGWEFSDIDSNLLFSTETIPNYDISSWSNEMIEKAINNYLNQSEYWNKCAVFSSEFINQSVCVRYQGGNEANKLTSSIVSWGGNDDYARISVNQSGVFSDIFHLTEYLDNQTNYSTEFNNGNSDGQVGIVITENDDLNVRAKPSTESDIISTVPKGGSVKIVSEENDWYKIDINSRTGYVLKKYVSLNGQQTKRQSSSSVSQCLKKGTINSRGAKYVYSYTTDYVCNGGNKIEERLDLEHGWRVTAKNVCTAYDLIWYEVWDTDDGDYYGWVDSDFIVFE